MLRCRFAIFAMESCNNVKQICQQILADVRKCIVIS